jgi:hypothetical protein
LDLAFIFGTDTTGAASAGAPALLVPDRQPVPSTDAPARCPVCGSVAAVAGARFLWCLKCAAAGRETRLGEHDMAGWSEYTAPEGRHGWQRADLAGCQVVDLQPCPNCGGLLVWWDVTGGRHCEDCSPTKAGPRLREVAQRLRERYARDFPQKMFGRPLTASQHADKMTVG